jgi:3-deoxy-manno-octulosonate cytidylyltransferase (CMP-KDO synthetase)
VKKKPGILVVIPARLSSTRLPRKPLLRETGKYLIEHVVERVRSAKGITRIVVATESDEVAAACRSFGQEALMTSDRHPSGTDRVAEAVAILERRGEAYDLVVNVQGDEPELPPSNVERLLALMADGGADMGTLAEPVLDPIEARREQVVKVVLDGEGYALYFSRAVIPHGARAWLRHVGIYAFVPPCLARFARLEPAPIERSERLEQLRALHHGLRLRVAIVPPSSARGVDTAEDYAAFVKRVTG